MFGTWEDTMVEAVEQAARDVMCELVSSLPIPEALSPAEVLDTLHTMRSEVDTAIRLYRAFTEEVRA
jgi:hypothetical protein